MRTTVRETDEATTGGSRAAAVPVAPRPDRGAVLRRRLKAVAARADDVRQRAPRLIAFLRAVYYPLALGLVAYIGYQASRKIDLASIHYLPLAGSYAAALVWWLSLAFGWSALVTERFTTGPVTAWCRTQVARYLPGGIWAPVARATTVPGRIRDKVAAVGAENVIVLCVALGVGALWATVHDVRWLPLVVVGFLPLLGSRWLARRTKVTRRAVVRTSLTFAFGYAAYGVSAVLAQIAVSGVREPTYPLYVAGAACVAWAVGLVVVFAPGGVGVRELVYVWILTGLYPTAELKGAAVASRLVSVLAELSVLAVVSRPRFPGRRLSSAE